MEELETWLGTWGDHLWTWIVLPIVAALGLYLTVRSGVVQIRLLPEMFRTLSDKTPLDADGKPQSVSSFQAFTMSAASRVGTGNIAGVATAIAIGGPGAVFWMWLMAAIGAASAFAESSLAQLFKVRDSQGFRGGPAYYMAKGLGARWMGVVFAVILIFCFPFAFSALQANTIAITSASAIETMTGVGGEWLPLIIGLVTAALTALVVFGGVRRIAEVTQVLVPVMALAYLLLGLAVVVVNIEQLPGAFASIFTQAFGFNQVLGATLGQIILVGAKRGMFSNEAGLGSAPNAGAAAAVTHPVKQGLVQSLGVYFDTMIVCSITAFLVLVAVPIEAGGLEGIELTQFALESSLGEWTSIALAVVVFMLAFSSIIGNYYYGEASIEFISARPIVLTVFRVLVVLAILVGSVASASVVWSAADGVMGLMAITNLVALALLSGLVFRLLKDYTRQRREGLDPVFTRDLLPDVKGITCWEDSLSVTGPLDVVTRRRQSEKHRDHLHTRGS
ncbi:alanine:cation symporter family protein [Microbacterium paludicola]|uniref:Alanine:cation symporter family protein n=1 Tax=Microbacterium paludicola TaxID=300019 RepID=A0A4Y9FW11_9MICO|nr:alanine/glycine:cation symporter family protein [Microbacterium paludicola]MBF0815870.1 alanine:cation symporter family protein [Microbacterium paludicola]TFU33511.1 alanine:cation symporter family protein [Microbacterium paludicola]